METILRQVIRCGSDIFPLSPQPWRFFVKNGIDFGNDPRGIGGICENGF